jgi:hypothetical protein
MGIYLGTQGRVELQREAGEQSLVTQLDPSDVNAGLKRFSVDFSESAIISGDRIEIATVDGTGLKLVSGHQDSGSNYYPDWTGFVHVDAAGGLRLYSTFAHAVTGGITNALALVQPSAAKNVSITSEDKFYNQIAQVVSYELTTSRDQVNTDVLGTEFHNYYEAGLISGQGQLSCFWEHTRSSGARSSATNEEFPAYLARLLLRLKQGAAFRGRFYLYTGESGDASVWYESRCLVNSFAVSIETGEVIRTNIQFVATGPIQLKQGFTQDVLLQEDGASLILQEDGTKLLLQEEG